MRSIKEVIEVYFRILLFSAVLLLSQDPAFAQQAQVPAPGFMDVIMRMIPLFAIIFFVFFFMVIKPQERRMRAQQQLIESLKKGDTIVTSGGLIARVAGIEKDHILLELGANARIKVQNSHVVKLYEKPEKSNDTKSAA